MMMMMMILFLFCFHSLSFLPPHRRSVGTFLNISLLLKFETEIFWICTIVTFHVEDLKIFSKTFLKLNIQLFVFKKSFVGERWGVLTRSRDKHDLYSMIPIQQSPCQTPTPLLIFISPHLRARSLARWFAHYRARKPIDGSISNMAQSIRTMFQQAKKGVQALYPRLAAKQNGELRSSPSIMARASALRAQQTTWSR
jgi:hypothetical protein